MTVAPLGIRVIDRMVSAPPPGVSWAIAHQPGLDVRPFLHEAVRTRLRQGGSVLYVALDRHPSAVAAGLHRFGLDTDAARLAGLEFVDGYSRNAGAPTTERLRIDGPADSARLAGIISRTSDAGTLVVIESISGMLDRTDDFTRVAIGLRRILRAGEGAYGTIAQFTRWPYPIPANALLESFDAVVSLGGYYGTAAFGQYVQVERASWREKEATRQVPVRAVPKEGVLEYIPKIVVTGAFHAGKSSFVEAVSESSVNGSALGTTVVADHGRVVIDGLTTDLFGTPGQERFDPLLWTLSAQALGVVLMVDSTDPSSFPRARDMMRATRARGIPLLVLANKQDLPGALSPSEVARLLPAPSDVLVRGCSARDKESLRAPLRELLFAIRQPAVIA